MIHYAGCSRWGRGTRGVETEEAISMCLDINYICTCTWSSTNGHNGSFAQTIETAVGSDYVHVCVCNGQI